MGQMVFSWMAASPERIAYLAGLFEGEGHIRIGQTPGSKCPQGFSAALRVSMISRDALELFLDAFGGSIYHVKARGRSRAQWWWVVSAGAGRALEALRPFLVVKAKEADIALRYSDTKGKQGRPVDHLMAVFRAQLASEIRVVRWAG